VNQLLHLPGVGTFHMAAIRRAREELCPLKQRRRGELLECLLCLERRVVEYKGLTGMGVDGLGILFDVSAFWSVAWWSLRA
jgi:hypothetical protein